jgi:hypothetical protein
MQTWEYLFASLDYHEGQWRVKFVNGDQVSRWESITVYDYVNKLGSEGWELVAAPFSIGSNEYGWRLCFKRPKQ